MVNGMGLAANTRPSQVEKPKTFECVQCPVSRLTISLSVNSVTQELRTRLAVSVKNQQQGFKHESGTLKSWTFLKL